MRVTHLLMLALPLVALAADPCNVHGDCQSCVSGHLCGWCSTNVVYKNGDPGAHCASNDGTHPFACYGIFSTEDCIRGYVCNTTLHICTLGNPGEGLPYTDCISACGSGPVPPQPPTPGPGPAPPTPPPAETYLCNSSDWTCFQTTPGHGTSKDLCTQSCHAPTPSMPAPPPPPMAPTPPAQTYLCNTSTFTCDPTVPGRGTSKEVCVSQCKQQPPSPGPSPAPGDRYLCNFETWNCDQSNASNATSKAQCDQLCIKLYQCDQMNLQCVIAPFPTPGLPLPDCQDNCKPHNVTPSDLLGLWRGIQVNTGYTSGEWDAYFDNNNATFVGPNLEYVTGLTSYLGPNPRIIFQLRVTVSTFPSIPVNAELSMIFQADGASPETRFLQLASGAPNKPAPADFKTALSATDGYDWSLASCQPGTACFFRKEATMRNRLMRAMELAEQQQEAQKPIVRSGVDDPCMPFPSCDQCLAQPYCGWCSVDVIYKDGTVGRHCAGWGPNGTRNQFECHGVWHTDECNDYQCLQPQGQCVKVPLGGGESKADCEATCVPAPSGPTPPGPAPPTPPPAETYLCNSSDWTCFQTTPGHGTSKDVCTQSCHAPTPSMPAPPPPPMAPTPPAQTYLCNTTAYTCDVTIPGHGTSKEVCVQQCTKPPAPTPLQGTWRGIQIDNQYKYGEYVLTLDKGFTMTHDGQPFAQGSMYAGSSPGTLKISFSQGWNAGKDFLGLYTESQGVSVMHLTLVMGSGPTDQPSGWDKPWIAGGSAGTEFVFMKVNAA